MTTEQQDAYHADDTGYEKVKQEHEKRTTIGTAQPVLGVFQSTAVTEEVFLPGSQNRALSSEEPIPPPANEHLQRLLDDRADNDVKKLELGVQHGIRILAKLEKAFTSNSPLFGEAIQWKEQVQSLRKHTPRGHTVIGVVGNTGAGKSSIINAVLDEGRLLPTNCMRACTAVVTEISWNDNDDPRERYRATVEFLSAEDWKRELEVLFKDLVTSKGDVSREYTTEDSEAGVAYAKIRAVYPQVTKEMMAKQNVDKLMQDPSVLKVLGRTIEIQNSSSTLFYRELQQFVDNKGNVSEEYRDSDDPIRGACEKKEMEHWPLIRVVKIHTRADILSTGATIVDLPGVQDSNTARAAIAESYIKKCTGLWIVAPITRAVNDKSAKHLLGAQFKRQMKYDGTYSQATFICSKSDDISITEAADTLGLENRVRDSFDKKEHLETLIESLKGESNGLTQKQYVETAGQKAMSSDLDKWRRFQRDIQRGKTVFAPQPRKRKPATEYTARLRSHTRQQDSAPNYTSIESEATEKANEVHEIPLTEEQVVAKIKQLNTQKDDVQATRASVASQQDDVTRRLSKAQSELEVLDTQISEVCIRQRNHFTKNAIREDFAAGIRELDHANAIEENEEDADPEDEIRNYDSVAAGLDVFCVSSRAYQKLHGRLRRDTTIVGFKNERQTEVPQLRAHCMKMTEAGRITACRNWLNSLSMLLNSLSLWSSYADGSGKLSAEQRQEQTSFLQEQLQSLQQELEVTLEACVHFISLDFQRYIYARFKGAIAKAQTNAVTTANSWGAHQAEGGLYWSTYKAIVRRDGSHSGKGGPRDFNAELAKPMLEHLSTGWEKTFQRRLPTALKSFTKETTRILKSFHTAIEDNTKSKGLGIAAMGMLASQLNTYSQKFQELADGMQITIVGKQRTANREFVPAVTTHMAQVYEICANESGRGSYTRMKDAMTSHVDDHKDSMFREATEVVQQHLNDICKTIQDQMQRQMDFVIEAMVRDYKTAFGDHLHVKRSPTEIRSDRKLRVDITEQILSTHEVFRRVCGPQTPAPKPDVADEHNEDVPMEDCKEVPACGSVTMLPTDRDAGDAFEAATAATTARKSPTWTTKNHQQTILEQKDTRLSVGPAEVKTPLDMHEDGSIHNYSPPSCSSMQLTDDNVPLACMNTAAEDIDEITTRSDTSSVRDQTGRYSSLDPVGDEKYTFDDAPAVMDSPTYHDAAHAMKDPTLDEDDPCDLSDADPSTGSSIAGVAAE